MYNCGTDPVSKHTQKDKPNSKRPVQFWCLVHDDTISRVFLLKVQLFLLSVNVYLLGKLACTKVNIVEYSMSPAEYTHFLTIIIQI